MVATRWNANLKEILNWFEDGNLSQNLGDLFLGMSLSDSNSILKIDENNPEEPEIGNEGSFTIPDELPILPLRGLVV
ncbi:MAG TPA: hypothetical protein VF338_12395, partial [Leptolinea sp.]